MGVVLFGCQGPAPVHPGGLWVYCHWPILYKKNVYVFLAHIVILMLKFIPTGIGWETLKDVRAR